MRFFEEFTQNSLKISTWNSSMSFTLPAFNHDFRIPLEITPVEIAPEGPSRTRPGVPWVCSRVFFSEIPPKVPFDCPPGISTVGFFGIPPEIPSGFPPGISFKTPSGVPCWLSSRILRKTHPRVPPVIPPDVSS